MKNRKRWDSFLQEISNILFFWFFGVIFFFIYRCFFVGIFNQEIGVQLPMKEYLSTFLMGFRFDCTAVAYFMLIPLLCTLLFSYFNKFKLIKRIRQSFQILFVICSTLICLITLNFYKEFNDQFNDFLFLGLYDDLTAVFETIVQYYHPITNSLLLIGISAIGIAIFWYFERSNYIYTILKRIRTKTVRSILVIATIYLFVCCIRGTLTHPPVMRKWSSVSSNAFLNKTIINPYRSLKYAYEDFKTFEKIDGVNPFIKGTDWLYESDLVSEIIKKNAQGPLIDKPQHIFLVIMESYDAWPLMDAYSSFGLSNELNKIAKKGTHFYNFLPAHNSTFHAYSTITAGIPYNGINISKLATRTDPYVTSLFSQFKELGYTTKFYYGGFLSWQNVGPFSTHIGCDEIYSGAGQKKSSGTWGVEDEELFDLVFQNTKTDEYTFSVILTTSYHSPYSVDVDSKGFTYQNTDQFPDNMKEVYDGRMNLKELGHLWYGDYAIGKFLKQAENTYESSLFAFTGDHYGRRFINHTPNLYEQSAVPFILYGKDIPIDKKNTPGSHIDIAPTLIELIAPKDFEYYSFGTSLLLPNKNLGIAFEKTIDTDSLYFAPKDASIESINLTDFSTNLTSQFKYKEEQAKLLGLSWHYIIKGDSLHKEPQFTIQK